MIEKTFVMIKPEGIKRRLISSVIQRFENKGLYLTAAKCTTPTREILHFHYPHLKDKPFFEDVVSAMTSGMVLAMVWSGENAVTVGRAIVGETDPMKAAIGTIRGDYCVSIMKNVVHASDSVENAKKEILLWHGIDIEFPSFFDKELIFE